MTENDLIGVTMISFQAFSVHLPTFPDQCSRGISNDWRFSIFIFRTYPKKLKRVQFEKSTLVSVSCFAVMY